MTVEDTLRIAIDALGGQKDLAGAPAILHALAVGLMGQNELEQKVGFLHDVVEDSDLTIENLREMGVEEDVLQAVDLLTHKEGSSYEDYVRNILLSGNDTAIQVKINDLHHNEKRCEKSLWEVVNAEKLDKERLDMFCRIDKKHTWALSFFSANRGPFPIVSS